MERLSTGLSLLDRRIGGGIPPGQLVALVSPPDVQAELLLEALSAPRGTLYVSTVHPPEEIRRRTPPTAAGETAGDRTVVQVSPREFLEEPDAWLSGLAERSTVVVDPTDDLEAGEEYRTFLTALRTRLTETGSVGVLHCLERASPPEARWLTLKRADAVWELRVITGPLAVESRLYVTKDRDGSALEEPVKLRLTDSVRVDTSRDIA